MIENIVIPIVSVVLSGMVSIAVAFLTAKLTSDNEMKRTVREKRQILYIECYEILTKIKNNPYMVFDYDTVSALKDLVAKVNLIASKHAIESLRPLYEQINITYINYSDRFDSEESILQRMAKEEFENANEADFEQERNIYEEEHLINKQWYEKELATVVAAMRKDVGTSK